MANAPTTTEERALKLLASGVTAANAAVALGISDSRISQLVSDESFASKLVALKFESLQKHNARDEEYDGIEDVLIEQLKLAIPMMMQPEKIARVLSMINSAKRRGASSPDSVLQKQQVVRLTIPIQILNRFSTNSAQQIISVNDEDMITVQSGRMNTLLEENQNELKSRRDSQTVENLSFDYTPPKPDKFGFDAS